MFRTSTRTTHLPYGASDKSPFLISSFSFHATPLYFVRSLASLVPWCASKSRIGNSELEAIVQLVDLIRISPIVARKGEVLQQPQKPRPPRSPTAFRSLHITRIFFLSEKSASLIRTALFLAKLHQLRNIVLLTRSTVEY